VAYLGRQRYGATLGSAGPDWGLGQDRCWSLHKADLLLNNPALKQPLEAIKDLRGGGAEGWISV
jgi:hypothetical protein